MTTPTHLLPTSCYVCGSAEPHPPTPLHAFTTNAQADAEFAAQGPVTVTYPNGTHSPEANYVATYRPY